MTLAEIREELRREIVAHALTGSPSSVDALVLRVGRPLVLRHVLPRQRVRMLYGNMYGGSALVVERVEREQVIFDSPRVMFRMDHFLKAVVRGAAQDDG